MRTISLDWERDAAHAVGVFRAQLGQGVLDDSITALVGQLEAESEDFGRLWRSREVSAYAPGGLAFNHPRLGPVEFEYVKMHAADDDKTLVAFLAAPGSELACRLAALIAEDDGTAEDDGIAP